MTVVASVLFDDGPAAVRDIRILQKEFQHERAIISVDNTAATSKRFQSGAPVSLEWGFPHKPQGFYGYVSHVTPVQKPVHYRSDGGGHVNVVCVGPTWILKDGGFDTFRNVPATTAVRKIAEQFRFDTRHVQPHSQRWPVLNQKGRSYWEFMVECAMKAGWTLFARGLEIHCLDRKRSVQTDLKRMPSIGSTAVGGSLREFKPSMGTATPSGGDLLVREAYTVNPRTNTVLFSRDRNNTEKSLSGAPALAATFSRGVTDKTFDSLGEGYDKLQSASRGNQLSVEASFSGDSHPHVRVGSAVDVVGFGEGNDGVWYVTEVEHHIQPKGVSAMHGKVGRDTARSDGFLSGQPISASAATRGARLVNGKWVL